MDSITYGFSAVTPQAGAELLKRYSAKISSQFGVTIPQHPQVLGQGTRGTAYVIGGGKVLKLTDDESEAAAAAKLRDLKVDFAVHIEAVFQMRDYYGIIQEQLQPLPAHAKAAIEASLTRTDFREKIAEGGFQNFMKKSKEELDELARDGEHNLILRFKSAYETLEKYGVFEIAKGLESIGIEFTDYHTGKGDGNHGNLMLRGDKVVVLDLGYSKGGGGKIDPIKERADLWQRNAQMAWRSRMMKLTSR